MEKNFLKDFCLEEFFVTILVELCDRLLQFIGQHRALGKFTLKIPRDD